MNTTFTSTDKPLLNVSPIDDLKQAASKMLGAERRSFEAAMALKYCQGNARQAELLFGWSRGLDHHSGQGRAAALGESLAGEWQDPRNLVPLEGQTHRGRRKMLEGPARIDYSPDTRPVPPRTVRSSMVGGS
jgi:hypothetical protein